MPPVPAPALLIANARLLDPAAGLDALGALHIADGRIAALGPDLAPPDDVPVLDAGGLCLAPGLVDLRVATGEPGHEHRETITSLAEAAGLMHFDLVAACPQGFQPEEEAIVAASGRARVVADPREAVEGADIVVTDCWVSMGQAHADTKLKAMMPYQVTPALMARAKPDAKFLHCLPAHRGEEVTADVIDGPQSLIWAEAENRLHAQKSILRWCFGQIG